MIKDENTVQRKLCRKVEQYRDDINKGGLKVEKVLRLQAAKAY